MAGIARGISPFFKRNTGGSTPPPVQGYYLREIIEINTSPLDAADSVTGIFFDGWLYKSYGWNPAVYSPYSNGFKWQRSNDGGRTWEDIADAPYRGDGYGILVQDNKIYVAGYEGGVGGTIVTGIVMCYDPSNNTWSTISSDLGIGLRYACNITSFNGKFYFIGGQDSISTPTPTAFTDIIQVEIVSDNAVVTTVGAIPYTFFGAGTSWATPQGIFLAGGGKLIEGETVYEFLNDKIYLTTNNFTSFTEFATLPVEQQSIWPDTQVFDNKVWWINGYADGDNQQGLYNKSYTSTTFNLYNSFEYAPIPARHFTCLVVEPGVALYFICGNMWNDVWRVEPVTPPTFVATFLQNWWLRIWPDKRPTQTLVNHANTAVQFAIDNNLISEIAYLNMIAGFENEDQMIYNWITLNTDFVNYFTKVNGNPIWSSNGVKSTGATNGPLYKINWVPRDNGGSVYTLDSAGTGIYGLENLAVDVFDAGTVYDFIAVRQSNDRFYGLINDTTEDSDVSTDSKGLTFALRTSSTDKYLSQRAGTPTHFNRTSVSLSDLGGHYPGYLFAGTYYTSNRLSGAYVRTSGSIDVDKLNQFIELWYTLRGVPH